MILCRHNRGSHRVHPKGISIYSLIAEFRKEQGRTDLAWWFDLGTTVARLGWTPYRATRIISTAQERGWVKVVLARQRKVRPARYRLTNKAMFCWMDNKRGRPWPRPNSLVSQRMLSGQLPKTYNATAFRLVRLRPSYPSWSKEYFAYLTNSLRNGLDSGTGRSAGGGKQMPSQGPSQGSPCDTPSPTPQKSSSTR